MNKINFSYINAEITIELRTKIAQELFNGSWKDRRIGLIQFATFMNNIWQAAKQNDPYAEWFLLKAYQNIFATKEYIKKIEEEIESIFKTLRGIQIKCESTSFSTYPLKFGTPFGYMGAYLLTDVDHILKYLLAFKKIGLVIPKNLELKEIKNKVRQIFSEPLNWRLTGVTRNDMIIANEMASKAKEMLGELPEAILKKEIELSFLPRIERNINGK